MQSLARERNGPTGAHNAVLRPQNKMDGPPFLLPAIVNNEHAVDIQVDSGCSCYAAVSERWAQKFALKQVRLPHPRDLGTVLGTARSNHITHMAEFCVDLDTWTTTVWAYVIPGMDRPILLGLPWLRHRRISFEAFNNQLVVHSEGGLIIKEKSARPSFSPVRAISGAAAGAWVARKGRARGSDITLVGTSLGEITRILQTTAPKAGRGTGTEEDLAAALPPEVRDFVELFDKEKASGLPPHRGQFDHHIRLTRNEDGSAPAPPWGPLYDMPRDQLLELRKQVTDLCDKGWVRASSSAAAAPVLLVRKASGGWRFCVDYRGLNKITQQDRYPLPLIRETLRSLSGARWFSKFDVRAAFHRIRIAEGDEHLTAFRTRFGLFEWLVTPFGLAGAPATFQRYINSALADVLDDFVTAYLDDVLVFSSGSRRDHMAKVREVLRRLAKAGLNLDLDKCAFAVKEVKYLGYIIRAGEGIQADPEKVRAIREWEPPHTVRGVRSFLGFANFYRDFIRDFSALADPLIRLTVKGVPFCWGPAAETAFHQLKQAFIEAPILTEWDPDLDAVVEADCSRYAMGACLSVWKNTVLRPVAYFSARLSPAQQNYTIHDKELLAVVKALEAWSSMLRSVRKPFTILSDHKGLEYFTKPRLLSERQARWAGTLSLFRFHLRYRPGLQAARPDALSRREQDESGGREVAPPALSPVSISELLTLSQERLGHAPDMPRGNTLFEEETLRDLWDTALQHDHLYTERLLAVHRGDRRFPAAAQTTAQIAECTLGAGGALRFRGRLWLPNWEPLTTAVLQRAHDSPVSGHPGREGTFHILGRDFHWDNMAQAVRRFVRNCDVCRRAHPLRRLRQGLLKPIPPVDQFWTQISVDFMTDLPANDSGPRYLMVITDRLSKYIQLEAMHSMSAEACATRFRDTWWRFHGFPREIISDRGSDWTGAFWASLCAQVGVKRLLSTAHHPETDGGTERANQEVQKYLRVVIAFSQQDWPNHLPACQLALNNRDSSVTGVSPNRLLNGFEVRTIPGPLDMTASAASPKGRAALFLDHLREGVNLAQSAVAFVQQQQEASANRRRRPAEVFRVGDQVWLSLRNLKTNRPSKKLDWLRQKYTVLKVPTPHTVVLDIPGRPHNTFHVDLIDRAADDPLPSQGSTDTRPGPTPVSDDLGEEHEEFYVEEILAAKNAPGRPRGGLRRRQVLVKWQGWDAPTWEPLENYENSAALVEFERRYGDARNNDGPHKKRARRRPVANQSL